MTTTADQKATFRRLAMGTNFQLNLNKPLVEEFARLATKKGWNDKNCRKFWRQCFGTQYPNTPQQQISTSPTASSSSIPGRIIATPPEDDFELVLLDYAGSHGLDLDASLAAGMKALTVCEDVAGKSKGNKKKKDRSADALRAHFEDRYGSNASDLVAWQALCKDIGIEPEPKSITQAKKSLKGVLVNLVDLVETGTAKKFTTYKEFRRYTKEGRVFSKSAAKKNAFLKVLLRQVL